MLNEEIIQAIEATKPMCVATADKDGRPNIIYMSYIKAVNSKTLVAADCAFAKTRDNLTVNPRMAVLVMHPETKRAFQIKCRTEEVTEGERFNSVAEWVRENPPHFETRAAYYLHVEAIYAGADKLV
ncbi:pyridoxamine 5'-phosphate oxidase family protein [Coraliomargarita parva]|uniref:pyridoxamine 5'-phosphate oxidase family protein n=1 Tax=Coraliomargarita parva TaxID=3014050 RepID=UPI0022B55CAD|nr:pyridoxamine 5'-phosphate oxidase family protein [Coraliomargarita parva]